MIYVKRSDGAICSFDGMSLEQVVNMLSEQGFDCEEITLDEFTESETKARQITEAYRNAH